ncbi:DUF924 domain-containing protein [Roseomonas sp. PWR1]|uniref:DUF924 domain-containing protein n=1 Tax=Roseomonas nitratireducens TaxID=2820810 RepID=A0ABS4API5_9PROT|nr:DUF924 family protein [Neoroseomonas nitratireducens]MBP0463269.1 DUF924 domain-containing protein [Neoroseomonas nitratireducens]
MKDILAFWFAEGPDTFREAWFKRDDAFDAEIRARFGAMIDPARDGAFDGWMDGAEGALALAILLDQFPRNTRRGSADAFACDAKALEVARQAVLARRLDLALAPTQRIFLYLPFEHSEAMADQDLSVALFEGLRDDPRHAKPGGTIDYAWRHRAVIQRFGRFPHRNAALGRASTAAEEAWLAAGGGF